MTTTHTRRIAPWAADIHAASERALALSSAILIYTNRGEAYASAHAVHVDDAGRAQIGAGAPLTRESLGELAGALGAAATVSGFVPEQVVYVGPGVIAWWVPAAWRRIWFDCTKAPVGDQPEQVVEGAGGAAAADAPGPEVGARGFERAGTRAGREALGKRSAEVPHPPLVFVATAQHWYVRALADNARPGPDTPLMVAPYFNVWESGGICTGNVRLPSTLRAESLREWEDAFFRSKFTHPNAPRICAHPKGGYAMWAEVMERAAECSAADPGLSSLTCNFFPGGLLLPANQTLSAWIAGITKGEV